MSIMECRLKVLILVINISCFNNIGISQNIFSVTIKTPSQLDRSYIQMSYDNGKQQVKVKSPLSRTLFTISDSFYSRYATIIVYYLDKRGMLINSKSFFISDKPAQIIFYQGNKRPLEKYKLTNAYDIDSMGAEKLKIFDSTERKDFNNFMSANRDKFGSNESLQIIAAEKGQKVWNKELEFITKYNNLYYSFWLFRNKIVPRLFTNTDSLLEIFNSIFPDSLKQSIEGKEILKVLSGRIQTRKNHIAPAFTTTDTKGVTLSLKGLRGKYVILDFWATWCGSCIEEIPTIRGIRERYPKSKLVIISVTYDVDTLAFLRTVKKYNMNWIHVFGDEDLIKKYGDKAIPTVYLLDRTGRVIYSREEDKDYGRGKLVKLSKVLKKRLRK